MDGSDSLTRSEYGTALTFIQSIVRSLPISSDQVLGGMIEYSDKPNLRIPLNQPSGLRYSVLYIGPSRGTKATTHEMIELATTEAFSKGRGGRPGVPKYLLIITDDKVTPSKELQDAVSKAEKAGINIYVVDIGDRMNATGLQLLAPVPKNRYAVDDVASLNGIVKGLVKNILTDVAERKYTIVFKQYKYVLWLE